MKKSTAFILLLFFTTRLFSQLPIDRVDMYEFPNEIEAVKTVTIKMAYGKSEVSSISGDTAGLRNAGDILIDIICTDFPSTSSLSKLNNLRLEQFYKLFPYLSREQEPKIKVVRQMQGSEKVSAQELFHGLVIRFRPAQTKETMINDLKMLEEIVNIPEKEVPKIKISDSIQISKTVKQKQKQKIRTIGDSLTISRLKKRKGVERFFSYSIAAGAFPSWLNYLNHDSSCYLVITPQEALEHGYITKKDYNGTRRVRGWKAQDLITILDCDGHYVGDSLLSDKKIEGLVPLDSAGITDYATNIKDHPLRDSTLFKIFERNKWTNMDIVGDVTGSMYPYTAQLLLWLKLQSLDSLTADYSFFNDGDDKPDRKKRTGETGGIYSQKCNSFSEVLNLVKSTMMKGGGGDCPENNIEAILQSEKAFPDNDFHILISDNWAPIKDMRIAKQITKPVRIVLCGVQNNLVNTDYLNLARLTKGSVHLMEKDLFNLATMHEGEVLRIGKREYKIINGSFTEIGVLGDQRL